jgi:hypothetical protein
MPRPIKTETPRDRELSLDEIRQQWLALDRAPVVKQATKRIARGERAGVARTWRVAARMSEGAITTPTGPIGGMSPADTHAVPGLTHVSGRSTRGLCCA